MKGMLVDNELNWQQYRYFYIMSDFLRIIFINLDFLKFYLKTVTTSDSNTRITLPNWNGKITRMTWVVKLNSNLITTPILYIPVERL